MVQQSIAHSPPPELDDEYAPRLRKIRAPRDDLECEEDETIWELNQFLQLIAEIWGNPGINGNQQSEKSSENNKQKVDNSKK